MNQIKLSLLILVGAVVMSGGIVGASDGCGPIAKLFKPAVAHADDGCPDIPFNTIIVAQGEGYTQSQAQQAVIDHGYANAAAGCVEASKAGYVRCEGACVPNGDAQLAQGPPVISGQGCVDYGTHWYCTAKLTFPCVLECVPLGHEQ